MALPNLAGLKLEPAARACAPTGPFVALTDADEPQIDPFSTEPLPKNKRRGQDGATFAVKTPNRADGGRPEQEYNFYDAKSLARLVHMQMRERKAVKDPLTREPLPRSDIRDLLEDYPAPPNDAAADRVEPLDDDSDAQDSDSDSDADGDQWPGSPPDWAEEWLREAATWRSEREYTFVRPFVDNVFFSWRTEYERGVVGSTVRAAGLPFPATQTSSLFEVRMRVREDRAPAFMQYVYPMRVRDGRLERERVSNDAVVRTLHSAFLPEHYPADAYALLNQAYRSNAGWEPPPPPNFAFGYVPEVGKQLIAITHTSSAGPGFTMTFTFKIAPQLVRMLVLRSIALRERQPDPLLALIDRIRVLRARQGTDARGRLGTVPEMATMPPHPETDPSGARLFWQGYAAQDGRPDADTWRRSLAVLIEGQARLLQWAERFGGPLGTADPEDFLLASEPYNNELIEEWAVSAAERLACARRHEGGLRTHERNRRIPPARTFEFAYFAEVPIVYWRAREHPPLFARPGENGARLRAVERLQRRERARGAGRRL